MKFNCSQTSRGLLIPFIACLLFSGLGGITARAQDQASQTPEMQQMQKRVEQLEKELQEIKAELAAKPAAGAAHPVVGAVELVPGVVEQPSEEEEPPLKGTTMKIYGATMLDSGYNAGSIDPNWFDVVRPTKLPAFQNEFGKDGNYYTGVRQSRFGVRTSTPTALGDLNTIFEFELFGTGSNAGQTTFRLRHAWGELGQIGAGQTWSPFMDPDVFPNSLEYWGPTGMVFYRNVQVRWTPYNKGHSQFMVALERPGASADAGSVADRIDLSNTKGRFPAPDFSAHYRYSGEHGHVQVATMLRYIKWDDLAPTATINNSGSAIGWGVNTSANWIFNKKKDTARLQYVYGNGIENYMNDAPVDLAPVDTTNPTKNFAGKALPVYGVVSFLDHNWSDKFTSAIGYSLENVGVTALEPASSFKRGQYGLVNLLYYPAKSVMVGGEFQWGQRENARDHWSYNDYRVQFGFKYNFSFELIGGNK